MATSVLSSGVQYPDGSIQTTKAEGGLQKSQTFTSSGTFTVPPGVTGITVMCVGGGGGGGSSNSPGYTGGGGGGEITKRDITVSPGGSYPITIGSGGSGAPYTGSIIVPGGNGGTTSFAGIVNGRGGWGAGTLNGGMSAGAGGGLNQSDFTPENNNAGKNLPSNPLPNFVANPGISSGDSISGGGGCLGYPNYPIGGLPSRVTGGSVIGFGSGGMGPGGGGASYGNGGNSGSSAGNNTGGGGGGGYQSPGGNGGPGICIVTWVGS